MIENSVMKELNTKTPTQFFWIYRSPFQIRSEWHQPQISSITILFFDLRIDKEGKDSKSTDPLTQALKKPVSPNEKMI